MSRSAASQLLSGVRVLDLSRILAGPYCTMLLADLGADILKIERPGSGDETRNWGPPFKGGESLYFLSVNRNKRSACIDFSKSEGADIVRELAARSDVLIENFLPGRLRRYGLDYDALSRCNHKLVYCSITGYGQSGPWSHRAGYDVAAAAVGGFMHITGDRDGQPARAGVAVTDLATGLYASSAVLAALLKCRSDESASGCHIDANLLATQIASLSHVAAAYSASGQDPGRWGTGHASIVPYQAFPTSDSRQLIIGAGSNAQFATVCQLLGDESLAADARFADNSSRVANRQQLVQLMSQLTLQRSLAEWVEAFDKSGVPFAPVNDLAEALSSQQVQHQRLMQRIRHPAAGDVLVPAPALRVDGEQPEVRRPPPMIGQHTASVLRQELGYSELRVQQLMGLGVVQ